VLGIGTSTDWCSVALWLRGPDGERVHGLDERAGQAQSRRLLPMVQALMREQGVAMSDLDAIAFDAGPGAFTGLRIGCGVAQGLGFALERPLVAVASLEALALQAGVPAVLAAIDARMQEVYCAAYRVQPWPSALGPMSVLPHDAAARQLRDWQQALGQRCALVGDLPGRHPGLAAALETAGVQVIDAAFPQAGAIARLGAQRVATGAAVAARDAAPVYVRDKVALDVDEQRALRAARAAS